MTASPRLCVWYLTDGRPGHRNQLRGLSERLRAHTEVDEYWIDLRETPVSIFRPGQTRALADSRALPDWIVGAGSKTHFAVLACSRMFRARRILLMKPSLPLRLFDALIIPAHDNPPQSEHILVTRGVLNTVTPRGDNNASGKGVMLLGGPSKHYEWDSAHIVEQVREIATQDAALHWQITDSPRSPDDLLQQIDALQLANVSSFPFNETDSHWVSRQLQQADVAWVSRDSVSMVYESLTAGLPTGLLHLQALQGSRVARGVEQLIEDGRAQCFQRWLQSKTLPAATEPLWEADRAAQWLLQRFPIRKPGTETRA